MERKSLTILTQFNFWNIVHIMHKTTIIYKKAPDYLIQFLKENGVEVEQYDEKPEDACLLMGTYLEWPKPEELKPEIFNRKFHIDDENYYAVISQLREGDELIYLELSKKLPEGYKATCYKDNPVDAPKERIILEKPRKTKLSLMNEITENADIVHYVGHIVSTVKYRRFRLNEALKKKYKVSTIYGGFKPEWFNTAKALVISDPRESIELCMYAKTNGIPVYYDRTDNWSALYSGVEQWLFDYADYITTSAEYLQTGNSTLIENGYEKWNGTIPENKSNIAVYVGKSANKPDEEFVHRLMAENPDWQFVSIGASIEGTIHMPLLPWERMMSFIKNAKIGLIPLKNEDYFHGQFTLKVWDYLQAGLSVIAHNTKNMEHLPNFHEVKQPVKFDDYTFEAIDWSKYKDYEWDKVTERILKCYEL